MLLPKQGTLVSVTENLGRTLLLVEFADGQHEYLFEHEVKVENGNALREETRPMPTRTFESTSAMTQTSDGGQLWQSGIKSV